MHKVVGLKIMDMAHVVMGQIASKLDLKDDYIKDHEYILVASCDQSSLPNKVIVSFEIDLNWQDIENETEFMQWNKDCLEDDNSDI